MSARELFSSAIEQARIRNAMLATLHLIRPRNIADAVEVLSANQFRGEEINREWDVIAEAVR
jgi:hypothetical protein